MTVGKWTLEVNDENGLAYIVVSWSKGEAFFFTAGDLRIEMKKNA
jgi:hypothetical protein